MTNLPRIIDVIREDYRKLALYCIAAVIIFSLHDVLLDLALSFLHTIFDLSLTIVHTSFEWFEYALEELIEHIFHTSRQQTQTIVFYLLLTIGGYLAYRIVLKLTDLYRLLKLKAMISWTRYSTRARLFWRQQSTLEKIKLTVSGFASLIALSFLVLS